MDFDGAFRMLESMLWIRRVEEEIARLYREQEMRCPVHLCIGQEAAAVGVIDALERTDLAFSGHRSHHHYLAKGGDLPRMMAELYGKATGCAGGKGGSMHLIDLAVGFDGVAPILGSTVPIAVGTALAAQFRGRKRVSATFVGDAAVEEGVVHESIAFAAVRKLPVVFVCENNLYATHTPLAPRQPTGREIAEIARAHAIPFDVVDGNDVLAVKAAAVSAVARARDGSGPTFLELKTYRWLEHVGPNDDSGLGYRSRAEIESWIAKCPIERLKKDLAARGADPAARVAKWEKDMAAKIAEATAFAKSSPFPAPDALLSQVYA